jgi:hypothetical protein
MSSGCRDLRNVMYEKEDESRVAGDSEKTSF